MVSITDDWLWIVIVGFIISFLLAFGIGANDVANSFGTSVGSKVLTLVKACILGTIFEVLGAVLIGYKVSDTIRKGIVDVNAYNNSEELLLMGNLSALTGSCIWMFIATLLSLPVSATHSIVGATVGFSLVAMGTKGVDLIQLGYIFASWVISPVLSGVVSSLLFMLIRKVVLNKEKPLEPGLRLLPVFYGITILINAVSIFLDGSELLHFDKIPLYGTFIISVGLAGITASVVGVFVVPRMRKLAQEKMINSKEVSVRNESDVDAKFMLTNGDVELQLKAREETCEGYTNGTAKHVTDNSAEETNEDCKVLVADSSVPLMERGGESAETKTEVKSEAATLGSSSSNDSDSEENLRETRASISDNPAVATLFSFLQILTAIFGSFAHGGNDVSNAIGPLVALWVISTTQNVQQEAPTPIWILFYGGIGISVGLWALGRRVIQTMGRDLSKITPSSGFCIELGAAFTVLVASNIGIPVSTTHCKVGSIVFVGRVRSNDNVDWSLFRNIIFAWAATLPASGLLSALTMYILQTVAI